MSERQTKKMRKVDKLQSACYVRFQVSRYLSERDPTLKKEHCYSSLPCCGSNALFFFKRTLVSLMNPVDERELQNG